MFSAAEEFFGAVVQPADTSGWYVAYLAIGGARPEGTCTAKEFFGAVV